MTVLSAGIINAAGVAVIDNFDDGLDAAWTGETGSFGQDTTTVYEGAGSVTTTGASDLLDIRATPADGLPNYFAHGDRMRVYTRYSGSSTTNDFHYIYFSFADSSNWWRIELRFDADSLDLTLNDGNTASEEGSVTATFPFQTWLEVQITRDDGSWGGTANDITIVVTDTSDGTEVASLTTNNSTHQSNDGLGHRVQQIDNPTNADYQHTVQP